MRKTKKPTRLEMENYIHENGTSSMVESIQKDKSLSWLETVYISLTSK